MAKWTKADLSRMTQALDSWWLVNRPLSGPAPDGWLERARAFVAANRQRIVIGGISELRNLAARRATEDQRTAEHFRLHPEVYGASTPEMIERFAKLAREAERDVALADRLIARIEADGLPPELAGYNPVQLEREAVARARAQTASR